MTRPTLAITGASGGIGRLLVDLALRRGHDVIALSRRPMARPEPGFDWRPLDLGASSDLDALFTDAEVVVHLAACMAGEQPSLRAAEELWRVNVLGTQRVMAAAAEAGVRQVVVASAANFYSAGAGEAFESTPIEPPSRTLYLGSKAVQDWTAASMAEALGLGCARMRISSVIGSGQSVADAFAARLLAGETVTVSPTFAADFVAAADVAAGLLLAAERGLDGVYNLSSGRHTRLADLARLLAGLAGRGDEAVRVEASPGLADHGFPAINCDRMRGLGYAASSLDAVLAETIERARAAAPVRQSAAC